MNFRAATLKDLPVIISMLADDKLGEQREIPSEPLSESYVKAFARIDSDANQELIVVENREMEIIGTFQISFLQYLTYGGGLRAQLEAVRVRKDHRGTGLGSIMMNWVIQHSKEKGAHLLQLTTDKQRPQSIHFYEKHGFKASHEGMKLHFDKI